MNPPLSQLERVPLREAWKHEANDFTPWLVGAQGFDAMNLVTAEYGLCQFKSGAWTETTIA